MTTNTSDSSSDSQSTKTPSGTAEVWWYLISGSAMLLLIALLGDFYGFRFRLGQSPFDPQWEATPAPLVMQGGDPHVRALMRMISASEANSPRPYSILYGGEHFEDLSGHPDRCVEILVGPNTGDCSTAAGRYQMLTTTWYAMAKQYHPNPPSLFWDTYSFAPEYQDEVVYRWLSDPDAWGGADIIQLLQDGKLDEVLRILSPTWTSLGYGIETNSMTSALPSIYQEMLREEMKRARAGVPVDSVP